MDCEGESPSNERDVMESIVNLLIEDSNQNIDLEKCVKEGVEECNLTKSYPCGLSSKVCKSKGGLTLHSRAKHGEKTVVTKTISPLTSKVVNEITGKAAKSVIESKLYGESMSTLLAEADPKQSEDLVKHLATLYDQYCEKLDRDKLLKNFYKLMPVSGKMFVTKSKNMTVPAYNLIMIQIPDLLVGFYKRGNVKEKLPDIKPIEKSEFGSLFYIAWYVISKMYRKSKICARKDTPEQVELQSLLLGISRCKTMNT